MIKIARLISKDGAGVLFCLIGILVQGFHTYFIIELGSNLPDYLRVPQSILAALFFSFGLLYFLFKQGKAKAEKNVPDQLRFKAYISYFTWFEIFINEHYWARGKIYIPYINNQSIEWYDWSILAIFACAVPLVLQAYANSIIIPLENTEKEKEILDKYLPQLSKITNEKFLLRVLADAVVKTDTGKERRLNVELVDQDKPNIKT